MNPSNMDANEIEIINWCDTLRENLLNKYRKGREEHGTDFKQIDFQKEMWMEVWDLINYGVMKQVNERK